MAKTATKSEHFPLSDFTFRARADRGGEVFYKLLEFKQLQPVERVLYSLLGRVDAPDEIPRVEHLDKLAIQEILERLSREGLCGYVLALWAKTPAFDLPEDLQQEMRRYAMREYETWELQCERIAPVLSCLNKLTGKAAIIKGPATAAIAYPQPEFRHSADLDIVVQTDYLSQLYEQLQNLDYSIEADKSSLYRAGPLKNVEDIILQPSSEYIACDALPLRSKSGTNIDLKLDPLELGLKILELKRFYADLNTTTINGHSVSIPSLVDQMLITCCHLYKDNFTGLRLLLDLHLLAAKLNDSDWLELARRAEIEAVEPMVWAALSVAENRLRTSIPRNILDQIGPQRRGKSSFANYYKLSYRFMWNQNSALMMLLNALSSADSKRKLKVLTETFFPSVEFLKAYYYFENPEQTALPPKFAWLTHLYCTLVPAGLFRRTLGKKLWSRK